MSYIHHDRNNEQVLIPVTNIRGGTSHPSGRFSLHVEPILDNDPNKITFKVLNFPGTAGIICDGAVYVKQTLPVENVSWIEADSYTASSFFMKGDSVNIERYRTLAGGCPLALTLANGFAVITQDM
jgi:hypothetical protein